MDPRGYRPGSQGALTSGWQEPHLAIPGGRLEATGGGKRGRGRHFRRRADDVRRQAESIQFALAVVLGTAELPAGPERKCGQLYGRYLVMSGVGIMQRQPKEPEHKFVYTFPGQDAQQWMM